MHRLAPGTRVGAWRVKAWQGQGAYGAVYRAERVGWKRSEPGALKVSLWLWNWRMEREVELLSRLSHPSIPRLLDRGGSQRPSRREYPFFVMEWVQGLPLYAWAEQHAPSGQQVCRVVAQLARALEAVHAVGAVHRDVKGDNVLVQLLDRRAVLVDFGSCHVPETQRLTWQSLPPVTPEYLSPQAVLFYIRLQHHPDSYYPPSPADDLYALGVTAYRLVMGQYPPRIDARQDEQGCWQATRPDPRPLLESNPRVEPPLREVIARLLSDAPEARGTASQVAEALEAAAGGAEAPARAMPAERTRAWKPWLALAAAAACAVLVWFSQPGMPGASDPQAPDAGTTAVGDTSPTAPRASTPSSEQKKPLAQAPLPEPRPGQPRPDEKGRCPGPRQVAINGGCWLELLPMSPEECTANSYVLFKGRCFVPAQPPPKKPQPTSSPPEAR
ncbi:MAG TPA: serine/threonine-protein kinase [Myxococcaceae bacterium]